MFLHFLCWKTTTSKCCKNTVNTDVFEGPCAENTVNTVVFGATCKKPRTYRVFCAFWLKSIGIYGVFWSPSAENCVNSMVFERFWTSGKQKLLVFTGFCERNSWKTLVFAGFSRVFSCDFINFLHRLTGLDVDKTLPLRARARARARATLDMRPFSSSFHLGGIAGVRSLSIVQSAGVKRDFAHCICCFGLPPTTTSKFSSISGLVTPKTHKVSLACRKSPWSCVTPSLDWCEWRKLVKFEQIMIDLHKHWLKYLCTLNNIFTEYDLWYIYFLFWR